MNSTLSRINVDCDRPLMTASGAAATCTTRHARARVPVEPTQAERAALKDRIRSLLKEKTR